MTQAFHNIMNCVPKEYKNLLNNGIIVLPISVFFKEYTQKKAELIQSIKNNIHKSENSMHTYTCDTSLLNSDIQNINERLWYFVREYYELWDSKKPEYHGGFSLIYNSSYEKKLDLHMDDSLYTVNLCLQTTDLEGSEIVFSGSKSNCFSKKYNSKNIFALPKEDFMYIHLGTHFHQTNQLISGERINIVLWYK
jgi:hypothetical protein